MATKFSLLFFLTIVYKCSNSPVPGLIGDILAGAHNVFTGINQGLNPNAGGHNRPPTKPFGDDNTRPPNDYWPNQNGYNGHGQEYNQHNHGNHYGNNGVNRPHGHGHGHGHGRPPYNNNYYYGNGNDEECDDEHRPGHGHKPNKHPNYPNQETYGQPNYPIQDSGNYGYNNPNQGNNNYYNKPPYQGNNNYGYNRPNSGNNNFNKPIRPDQGFNEFGNQNNQGNPNVNNGLKPGDNGQGYQPTSISTLPSKTPQVTLKPITDAPLPIPVKPNETGSSGDKTTDPKRETDDVDDENFEIDIRIQEPK